MTTKPEISPLQLIANQLNSLKSTGPKTEAGKNVAKFNARRHGLTGQFYCMSQQDEEAYKTFEGSMLASLNPDGAYETQLAITITQDHWRLNRSRAVEFNLFGRGHDEFGDSIDAPSENTHAAGTMADTFSAEDRVFGNIALYETRIHRMIAKNEKRLDEIKAVRLAAEARALDEAELLVRYDDFLAKADIEPATISDTIVAGMNPARACLFSANARSSEDILVNGFVFSAAAIREKIVRDHRLASAKKAASLNWDTARIGFQRTRDAA
jgi:hypothetical protein